VEQPYANLPALPVPSEPPQLPASPASVVTTPAGVIGDAEHECGGPFKARPNLEQHGVPTGSSVAWRTSSGKTRRKS